MTAHCEACPFLACRDCAYRGGMFRVDHLPSITTLVPETSWWIQEEAAVAEEQRLIKAGKRAVAWFDAQGEGPARDEGRVMVREALQAAFGWLRVDDEGAA